MPPKFKNLKLLNLGCGFRHHPAWVNVDISGERSVVRHDLLKGIPFADSSYDAVYLSHLLEHLSKENAESLIQECFRVLKPSGLIRVVVPDLENIARYYLKCLDAAAAGDKTARVNYEWMMMEMVDQTARSFPGGQMGRLLSRKDLPNRDFIFSRIGSETDDFWNRPGFWKLLRRRIKRYGLIHFVSYLWTNLWIQLACIVFRIFGGRNAASALKEGLFRRFSGEVHRWMYDRFSLGILLEQSGFTQVKVCRADESQIPDFNKYGLDLKEGKALKPDSLYMEAVRP
jgi:predicted SAM-dependent methyltransferase